MHYFITGTDTDCGKTLVSQGLMVLAKTHGLSVAGMKPVASGGFYQSGQLKNADALALQQLCSTPTEYQLINPYCFEPPIAPHLAAQQAGVEIRPEPIVKIFQTLCTQADSVIVEGVGGWRVPLSQNLDVASLCAALNLKVILVVGMRLGCINHALLSAEAIKHSNAFLGGWIANCVQAEFTCLDENIDTLKSKLNAPFLGTIPYQKMPTAKSTAQHLKNSGQIPT